jgi:hypothetical protein
MANSHFFDMLSSLPGSFRFLLRLTESETGKDKYMTAVYIILLILAMLIPIYLYSRILKNDMNRVTYKKCPFCEQTVLKEDIACNHCGRYFIKMYPMRAPVPSETLPDRQKNQIVLDVTQTSTGAKDIAR